MGALGGLDSGFQDSGIFEVFGAAEEQAIPSSDNTHEIQSTVQGGMARPPECWVASRIPREIARRSRASVHRPYPIGDDRSAKGYGSGHGA